MADFSVSVEDMCKRLTASFQNELIRQLEDELMRMARPTIERVAAQMARGLQGNIKGYHQYADNKVHLQLVINDVVKGKFD